MPLDQQQIDESAMRPSQHLNTSIYLAAFGISTKVRQVRLMPDIRLACIGMLRLRTVTPVSTKYHLRA
jgi:hypothetical protein